MQYQDTCYFYNACLYYLPLNGVVGGGKVLGKFSVPGQRPNVLAVGAGGGCLDIFFLVYLFYFLSPCLGDGPI